MLDAVTGKTAPDQSTADAPINTAMQSTIDSVNNSSTNINSNPMATIQPTVYWSFASGQCYPLKLGTVMGMDVTLASFCTIYDTHIRAVMVWIIGVLGMLHAYSVWSETVREM